MSERKMLLMCITVMMWIEAINGLTCFVCNDAKSEEDCNWRTETCGINQRSCFTEIRNTGTEIRLKKSCYQEHACRNLHQQITHECPRVCTLCCKGDLCNTKPPKACSCNLAGYIPRRRTRPTARTTTLRTTRRTNFRRHHLSSPTTVQSTSTSTTERHEQTKPTLRGTTISREPVFTDSNAALTTYSPHISVTMKSSKRQLSTTSLVEKNSSITPTEGNYGRLGVTEFSSAESAAEPSNTTTEGRVTTQSIIYSNSTDEKTTARNTVNQNVTGFTSTLTDSINSFPFSNSSTPDRRAGNINLGSQFANTTPPTILISKLSSSPPSCEQMTFVPLKLNNTRTISCRQSKDETTVCTNSFGVVNEFNLLLYNQLTNITTFHQCQRQTLSVSPESPIELLCINMTSTRNLRKMNLLISKNKENNDSRYDNLKCSLKYFEPKAQPRRKEETDSNSVGPLFETLKRVRRFCGTRVFAVQCNATGKSGYIPNVTTPEISVASSSPTWMIPVIIAAVVVLIIIGVVIVISLFRKKGFYRVRKKVKPNNVDNK